MDKKRKRYGIMKDLIALKVKKGKETIKSSSSLENKWDDAEASLLVKSFKIFFKLDEGQKFLHNICKLFNKKRKQENKIEKFCF